MSNRLEEIISNARGLQAESHCASFYWTAKLSAMGMTKEQRKFNPYESKIFNSSSAIFFDIRANKLLKRL